MSLVMNSSGIPKAFNFASLLERTVNLASALVPQQRPAEK